MLFHMDKSVEKNVGIFALFSLRFIITHGSFTAAAGYP